VIILFSSSSVAQIAAILLGAVAGLVLCRAAPAPAEGHVALPVSRGAGAFALAAFSFLLASVLLLAGRLPSPGFDLFAAFYRSGALVFGGGHVVLPLLQAEVVPSGWISNDAFMAGYGAAQAVPGPLSTFAAYLGAIIGGWKTALVCLVAIFLPSFLLVIGILPYWESLRRGRTAQAVLRGVNAAVVGLLLAAFYTPVWTSAITAKADFGLAAFAFLLLFLWRTPPWLVVIVCAAGGQLLAALP
jgi:chromate transporter